VFSFQCIRSLPLSPHASSPGMSVRFPVRKRERTSHRPGWLVQPERKVLCCSRDPTKLRSLPDKLSRGAHELIPTTNVKTLALAGQASKGRRHNHSFKHPRSLKTENSGIAHGGLTPCRSPTHQEPRTYPFQKYPSSTFVIRPASS
jgi:hypothetical protein